LAYTHGTAWTQELIASGIMKVVHELGIEYMPTRNQIREYYGNEALSNKISKTLGYYGWAKELDLPVKSSETTTGKRGETFVAKTLTQKGYAVEQMRQNYPYDLFVNGCVKVDVKYSNLYHGNNGNFYSFALAKKFPTCDIYILVANDDSGKKSIYVLPSKDAVQKQISVGERTSIYSKYKNKFEYIDRMVTLFNQVA